MVYGRRRVGKTYLIKQLFKDRITFQHTGVSPIDQEDDKSRLKTQLESFYYALLSHGLEGYRQPKSWMEAFFQLQQLLLKLDKGERMVIFIDELPWMDTPRSGFLSAHRCRRLRLQPRQSPPRARRCRSLRMDCP